MRGLVGLPALQITTIGLIAIVSFVVPLPSLPLQSQISMKGYFHISKVKFTNLPTRSVRSMAWNRTTMWLSLSNSKVRTIHVL